MQSRNKRTYLDLSLTFPPPASNRNSRSSQLETSHDSWESRSSAARERSADRGSSDRDRERGGGERSSERDRDRDRYEGGERRAEPSRDSSYDRRGGHGERRDTRGGRGRSGGRAANGT